MLQVITAAVIDAMVASGCTPEQIAAAVKASLASHEAELAAKRERDRIRQRSHRSVKKANGADTSRGISRGVTATCCDEARQTVTTGDTVSLSPVPPSFPPHPPNNPLTPFPIQKSNSRGTRLPDDWQLTGPDLAYAGSKGLTEAETGDLAERFKSWALSASGPNAVKRNWHQAWQGWVQRDGPKIIAARAGPRSGFAKPTNAFQQRRQEAKEILDDLDYFARNGGTGGEAHPRLLPGHSG
jgi:hypothetical protein